MPSSVKVGVQKPISATSRALFVRLEAMRDGERLVDLEFGFVQMPAVFQSGGDAWPFSLEPRWVTRQVVTRQINDVAANLRSRPLPTLS
jgi:hypothetical protein